MLTERTKLNSGPALLLLNVVTSSMRNCLWPSSRLHGLQLFLNLCPFLSDEEKIDRVVPFTIELLSDEVPIVRAEACRVLVLIVSRRSSTVWPDLTREIDSVRTLTPQNANFIPEYLLPNTRHLASDPDVFVRCTYALVLASFADAAQKMLELNRAGRLVSTEGDGLNSTDVSR